MSINFIDFKDSIDGSANPRFDFTDVKQTIDFNFKDNKYIEKDEALNVKLKTVYTYEGERGQINEGKICSVKVITSDKESVQEINVEVIG